MKNRLPSPLPAQDPLQHLRNELACSQAELRRTRIELQHARTSEQQARHQALHDSLTELPNRSCFRQRLDHDLALGQPLAQASAPVLAVLYLDLDGFKPINDRHGHEAGDGVLRIVATRLARAVRSDDMVCRVGGDEFVCLLGDVLNRQQLSHLACKLFDAVSAPLRIGTLDLLVRPSIGIAVCPQDGDTTDALLRRADIAMYRAKRQQLGYAFFDATIDG
jgi:diguanylate cyclase (GGDEF)-like protein